jgi:hypothetical protein
MQRLSTAARLTRLARGARCYTDYPTHILNAPSTELSTLRNGVRVASQVRGPSRFTASARLRCPPSPPPPFPRPGFSQRGSARPDS